jgi:hypothetical protein
MSTDRHEEAGEATACPSPTKERLRMPPFSNAGRKQAEFGDKDKTKERLNQCRRTHSSKHNQSL